MCPMAHRLEAWKRLETDLDMTKLDAMTRTIAFADVITEAAKIVKGGIRGRVVVNIA